MEATETTEVRLVITHDSRYRIEVIEYRIPTDKEAEAMRIKQGVRRRFHDIYHFDTMSEAVHYVKEKLVLNITKIF